MTKERKREMLGKGAAPGREIERAKESEPKANFERDKDVSRKCSSCKTDSEVVTK